MSEIRGLIVIDELTPFTKEQYEYLFRRVRTSLPITAIVTLQRETLDNVDVPNPFLVREDKR